MFIKITDCIWQAPISNKVYLRNGWSNYRILFNGETYSVSMIKIVKGVMEIYNFARGVESFDSAVDLAIEIDLDEGGDIPRWAVGALMVLSVVIVYLMFSPSFVL